MCSGAGFRGGGLGFDSLSQEEKDKLRAASEKAQIAADPSVEPILKKLQEARETAQKEGGGRRSGDQPNK